MTKSSFRKHIITSSLLTIVAITVIILFCIILLNKYAQPSDGNTSIERGTVADVYYASNIKTVMIEMATGEQFQLVCPWLPKNLYDAIGYDLDQLADLLEGQNIEYRKMDKLPWVVEIYINNTIIDNNDMTSKQIITTHIGIFILGLIMLAFPVGGETVYLKSKYKIYKNAEKKRTGKLAKNKK